MNPRDKIIKILLAEYEAELQPLSLTDLVAHLEQSRASAKQCKELGDKIEAELEGQ